MQTTRRMTESVDVSQILKTTSASPETNKSPEMRSETNISMSEDHGEQEKDTEQRYRAHLAPDGGWGWAVLAATILVLALTLAFPPCIGIFYKDLQKEFQATDTETSWVPAIMTSVLHAGGKKSFNIK